MADERVLERPTDGKSIFGIQGAVLREANIVCRHAVWQERHFATICGKGHDESRRINARRNRVCSCKPCMRRLYELDVQRYLAVGNVGGSGLLLRA